MCDIFGTFFFFCFGSHENQTKKNEIAKEYTEATAVFRNLVSVFFLFHEGGSYLMFNVGARVDYF